MTDFLQLLSSGMATGAIYGLAALGFTLLWQASGTINFAQGEFVMLPAFGMLAFLHFGLPLVVSFVLTCGVAIVVLGLFSYQRLPVEQMPDISIPVAVVSTPYVGASAQAVEPSYIEALATSRPVRAATWVWNSNRTCKVPWAISG